MTAAELLQELAERGADVVVREPDRLRITAPAGVLTPELRAAVAAHKPALLDVLQRRAWADELRHAVEGWLSVHPASLWRSGEPRHRMERRRARFESLLNDYVLTGEPGDRRAAVFAANAVAAEAGAIARERTPR